MNLEAENYMRIVIISMEMYNTKGDVRDTGDFRRWLSRYLPPAPSRTHLHPNLANNQTSNLGLNMTPG